MLLEAAAAEVELEDAGCGNVVAVGLGPSAVLPPRFTPPPVEAVSGFLIPSVEEEDDDAPPRKLVSAKFKFLEEGR